MALNDSLFQSLKCTVFERGWLSSNNILFQGTRRNVLVDTGYCTHTEQTLSLVESALQGKTLHAIVNTHLHSDHCGGNAALQKSFPGIETHIPFEQAQAVKTWDDALLSFQSTGQNCPAFSFTHTVYPASHIELGDRTWEVHASPGHDTHSFVLFEPTSRTLISADALWQHGFGVVFEELDGRHAFHSVADTLSMIDDLDPATVIPGHGAVFSGTEAVKASITYARNRLAFFRNNPIKHVRYGMKVLIKYKLLELQSVPIVDFQSWANNTPYFEIVRRAHFPEQDPQLWLESMIQDLIVTGAASQRDGLLVNV